MPASLKHLTDKKLNLTSLLARWKDGLYYTAAIVKCDKINKRCLVCFEDGSEIWVDNRDVHIQLTLDQLNEDEDIVCCICDDGKSEAPNEIILCDVCQQGYHQKCHSPPVDSSTIDESEDNSDHKDWFCATCSYILNQSNRAKMSSNSAQQIPQQPKKAQPQPQQQQTQPKPKSQPHPEPEPPKLSSPKLTPVEPQPQLQPLPKQPVKTKQVPTSQQNQKTTIGPVKPSANIVQKQAPYYPLSNQVRVVATSSTAALASMTASSALVVGSSAGRTKQDLVNQSNRSSQRQQTRQPVSNLEVISPPVKHAVRKSSVNFVMPPIRQSALPTATRSVITNIESALKSPHLTTTTSPLQIATTPPHQQTIDSFHKSSPNNKGADSKSNKQQASDSTNSGTKITPWTTEIEPSSTSPSNSASSTTSGHQGSNDNPTSSSNTFITITNNSGKTFTSVSAESNNIRNLSSSPTSVSSNNTDSGRTTQTTVIVHADTHSNNHSST